ARHESVQGVFVDFLEYLKLVAAKPNHFDAQIVVDEFKLLSQRHKRLVLPQQAPQNVRQLQHYSARHVGIETNEGRYGVESIEEEVRIDLARERVHARLEQ